MNPITERYATLKKRVIFLSVADLMNELVTKAKKTFWIETNKSRLTRSIKAALLPYLHVIILISPSGWKSTYFQITEARTICQYFPLEKNS